ncbi:MAG: preprotein translocase subunit SecE [Bacillota bacterium]|nr:preprotein translocase subunit SecE [Bacillota bacterium]
MRARPRVARVRLLSPEQRLVAAIRRTYRNAVAYFRETRLEMRKVVWPSRRETMVYTLVVVASTAIVGLVIWVFDIGLSGLLRLIIR